MTEISNAKLRERAKGEPELGMLDVLLGLWVLADKHRCQVSWFV